ncbi:hypothetical protein QF042_004764 [Pedobacter sp. W3I1]|uniref:hypothetical protein n=1 Tax=Pedobacter sp. W3I1 TaxID=3042291 RepID=UPI002787824D|nr:hypothetical protein [Pedobacter sp. W3I1]MDQ0641199.1 hypothetical protein [Pedobacter sp. W3I1]
MENSQNQRVSPTSKKQFREDDLDIVKGAKETDQLEQMQQSAKDNPAPERDKAGTPAAFTVDKGERPVHANHPIGKPISAKGHALIDYALVASLLVLPSLLSLNKKTKRTFAAEALILLPYIALTRQPLAVKGLIPFNTHGKIDLLNVGQFALQSFFRPFRKSKKELMFNIALTALVGLNVMLTNWKQGNEAK